MIAVRGKRLGGGTVHQQEPIGGSPNDVKTKTGGLMHQIWPTKSEEEVEVSHTPNPEEVEVSLSNSDAVEVMLGGGSESSRGKKTTPSLADLAAGNKKASSKSNNNSNNNNHDNNLMMDTSEILVDTGDLDDPEARAALLEQANSFLEKEKALQEKFLQQKLAAATTVAGEEKKQKRRSTFEQSNKNKNGVLEWTAWTRGSGSDLSPTVGLPEPKNRAASGGPRPVNRRHTVTLHQAWVGPSSSTGQNLLADAKQRRRSTLEESNKNRNGVLEWTAWQRVGGSGDSSATTTTLGLPEQKKESGSGGPRPANRRRYTVTLHQAWVGPASSNGLSPLAENASKQRRRSTLEESNKNKNGVLEWTAWQRVGSSNSSTVGLPEQKKEAASGPKPANRRRYTVTLHQAWVGPASSGLSPLAENASKQRRRSTLEESNKNKNGVLEWTAWQRVGSSNSSSTVGLPEAKEKAATGPRPANRRRYTVTLHQAWVGPANTTSLSSALGEDTKKQRRRSTLEESNKNKNGVLEWTAWQRVGGKSSSAVGVPEATTGSSGPRPANRRRYTVTLHQAWVGHTSSQNLPTEANSNKQRRRSTFEQSNKNRNGVLEWTAWKRVGSDESTGLPEPKKEASGPRPVNRRRYTVSLHQAWVGPVAESFNANDIKQRRRSTLEQSNKNKAGVLEWTAWKRVGSDESTGLPEPKKESSGPKPVNRRRYTVSLHQAWVGPVAETTNANGKKQRRRSTLDESNKNKNGVLEWTAWKRVGSDESTVGLPEPKKGASGPRPVNRRRNTVTLHQAWVGPASSSSSLSKKQRRRSTLEESNKNKNGVLEWTTWKRPGDPTAAGLDTNKPMAGPRPVKRESVRSNVYQAWIDVDGVFTKLPREFAAVEEEKKEEMPDKEQYAKVTESVGDCKPTKPSKQAKTISTSEEASATEKVKSWISNHKYQLVAAGVVTIAAIGVKMAFGGKREPTARTA